VTVQLKEENLMRRNIRMCAAVVMGLTAAASAAARADDKQNVLPGPINSVSDLEDTAKLLFKLADTNNDDQISQKEAVDAGNLLVGGFFFRADTNGDGVLSADEARQAREMLFAQQPLLKLILERAKPNAPQENQAQNVQPLASGARNDPSQVAKSLAADPMRTIGNLLDTNHDQRIEATELRQSVQTGVQTLFLVADTNQDGQLSPYELNAAVGEVAKSAVQSVFQAADADRNNMLSMDEYDKALKEPAHAVFRVLDANADNQLSLDELQRAEQIIADQIQRLRVPEPGNSIVNQVRSGQRGNTSGRSPNQAVPASPSPSTTPAPTPR
jgi:Ca2+-binding EF-hand superfamily protein